MATEGGLEIHLGRSHPLEEHVEPLVPAAIPRALAVANRVGYGLVSFGFLMFLFSSYQLWGTDLVEAYHQRALRGELKEAAAAAPPPSDDPVLPPPTGESVAVLSIPKIGLDLAVVQGVGVGDLKKGPGHYPGTPLPGQSGNSAIAGHRTTYGAPFERLDELVEGDPVLVATLDGTFRYRVRETSIVKPDRSEVLDPTTDDRLTLTTCNPRYSAAERLIVVAALDTPARPGGATAAGAALAGQNEAGLSGAGANPVPTLVYGALSALALVATRWWGRRRRSRLPWLVASPALVVVLFLFFENFDRLLPGNI